MHKPASNRLVTIVSAIVSFVFVTFLVVGSSRAAFSDTTDNITNSVSAAGIDLVDDDAGLAMFNVSGIVPGTPATECVAVTYNGTITPSAAVQLYRSGAATGTGLETYLDMTLEIGTGGSSSSCTGFSAASTLYTGTLASFLSTATSYASAQSTGWTPSGSGQTRTFRISLSVQDNNAAQALTTGFGFVWEARS